MKNIWKNLKTPIIALAPMAGYTDPAFRVMCLKYGADIVYTEMVSVEAVWRKNQKTLNMLKLLPQEKNVILQLFGNQPKSFAKALKIINEFYKTEKNKPCGIDINFGCPAHKVTKTGSGSALMYNKKLAKEIIKTTLQNTDLPVSIKIRAGAKNVTAIDFVNYIKDLPISALMIHGRTLQQMFNGAPNYKIIKEIKKLLPNIPVLANGGINNSQNTKIILEKTNADGIGIARGAWGNPFIFSATKKSFFSSLTKGKIKKGLSWKKIKKTMLQHAKLFLKQQAMYGYEQNLEPLRKHLLLYCKGRPNASELRKKIIQIKTLKDLKRI